MLKKTSKTTSKKRACGKYSLAACERICADIESGLSVRDAAKNEGISAGLVMKWKKQYASFSERYARACEIRTQLFAEDLLNAVQDAHQASADPETATHKINACKLEIDTKKWLLSKLLPKQYGDRTQMVLEQPNARDVLPSHTAEEDAAFMRMLADMQAKTPEPQNITRENDE